MMNVSLPPSVEELLRERLATGQFESASEVIATALRQMKGPSPAAAANDDVFGLWSGRFEDGLAYEQTIRAEWDR
jgi:hypothetical protein